MGSSIWVCTRLIWQVPTVGLIKFPRSCQLRTGLSAAPTEVLLYSADRQGLKGRILCFGIFLCLPLKNEQGWPCSLEWYDKKSLLTPWVQIELQSVWRREFFHGQQLSGSDTERRSPACSCFTNIIRQVYAAKVTYENTAFPRQNHWRRGTCI